MANDFGDISMGIEFPDIPDQIVLSGTIRTGIKGSIKLSTDITNKIKRLQSELSKSPAILADIIDRKLQEAISAPIWPTKDGQKDIIDTGELLRSQNVSATSKQIMITYSVPYAAFVHYGGYMIPYNNKNARPVYISPRPWISNVLNGRYQGFNMTEVYKMIVTKIIEST